MDRADNIIEVVRRIVSEMTPVITIENVTTNSDGDYEVSVCKTYWLTVESPVVINGENYIVKDINIDSLLTLRGNTPPPLDFIQLDSPDFFHGTHRKVNEESHIKQTYLLPFVYLPVPTVIGETSYDSDIAYTADISPLFLVPYDERRDETDLHQELFIEPANRMADLFQKIVLNSRDKFDRPNTFTRREWMNFGEPARWGNNDKIFDSNVSGVELTLDLIVQDDYACECQGQSENLCAPVSIYENGAFIQSVDSGGSYSYVTGVSSPVTFSLRSIDTGVETNTGENIDLDINDSAGSDVGTLSTNTANNKVVTVADSNVTVNGTSIQPLTAESTRDIEIVDQNGTLLTGLVEILNNGTTYRVEYTIPESITMSAIQAKTLDSFRNGTPMGYNIAGDSNRAGSAYVPNMLNYYRQLFRQNNMEVYLNAASAQRAIDWADPSNNTQASLNRAVSQALGTDGEDTILEFGYGINDYNRVTTGDITLAEMKQELVDAINAYLAQKPRAHILLVAPTRTAEPKTTDLNTVYQEISDENGWELVSGYEATKSVFVDAVVGASQTAYYVETTHINDNGARRLVNYIASYIFHPEIQWAFTLPEYDPIEAETALVNEAVIETGQWNFVGLPQSDPSWRRLEPITVRPFSIWTIQHQGESRDIFWIDSIGTATRFVLPDLVGDETNWQVEAPSDAVELRINISRLGTAYDALGDTPIAQNAVPILTYDMPQSKINLGLPIRFNI